MMVGFFLGVGIYLIVSCFIGERNIKNMTVINMWACSIGSVLIGVGINIGFDTILKAIG